MNVNQVNTVTFTGVLGSGASVTALVFRNVAEIDYLWMEMVAIITDTSGKIQSVSLTGRTTITTSISSSGFAVTIS